MNLNRFYSNTDHWICHLRTFYFKIRFFITYIKVFFKENILGKYPGLQKGEKYPIWKKLN